MVNQRSLISIEDHFSSHLRKALRARYGNLPSAAFVAAQFNRRLISSNGVSIECVRRWLRGLSMPSYFHLKTLIVWLELDAERLLGVGAKEEFVRYPEAIMRLAEMISQMPPASQVPLLNFVSSMSTLKPK
jgi:hypothetical protein